MTKEQIVRKLNLVDSIMQSHFNDYGEEAHRALQEAIKLIEQESCENCIDRKALLEEIENGIKAGNYEEGYEKYPHINDMDDVIECIKYADNVQPKVNNLDKLKTEIRDMLPTYHNPDWSIVDLIPIEEVLKLIDKYNKTEGEE